MKNIKKLFLLLILSNTYAIIAMEKDFHLVIIPGQNGLGGQNIPKILPQYTKKYEVETPSNFPDFGQKKCINYLEETLLPIFNELNSNHKIIIHASSQGTATALNYFAHMEETKSSLHATSNYINPRRIKALILESVMLTGNSAIVHTTKMNNIPGAYYFMPYLAKLLFPFYSPAGKQACFSCNHLPKDLPIIILHAPRDPQLSFEDSLALYASLINKGHTNVYFIRVEHGYHVLMLNKNDLETKVLQAILHKHQLLPNISTELSDELSNIDLTPHQPKSEPIWQKRFDDIVRKETKLNWIDSGIRAGLICLIIFCAGYYRNNLYNIFVQYSY